MYVCMLHDQRALLYAKKNCKTMLCVSTIVKHTPVWQCCSVCYICYYCRKTVSGISIQKVYIITATANAKCTLLFSSTAQQLSNGVCTCLTALSNHSEPSSMACSTLCSVTHTRARYGIYSTTATGTAAAAAAKLQHVVTAQ
jgi:hypothetical protein